MSYSLLLLLGILGHTDPIPVAIRRVEQLEHPVLILGIRGGRGTAFSGPDEKMDDFVRSSSKGLIEFSQDTGWEACAQVCRNEHGQYAWRATTAGSHVFCLAIDICPYGYTTTGVSVHTHPALVTFQVNQADADAMKVDGVIEGQWLFSGNPIGFSEPDLLSDPGYLVEPSGRILFHEGRAVRIVWQGNPLPAMGCFLGGEDACNPFQRAPTVEALEPSAQPPR